MRRCARANGSNRTVNCFLLTFFISLVVSGRLLIIDYVHKLFTLQIVLPARDGNMDRERRIGVPFVFIRGLGCMMNFHRCVPRCYIGLYFCFLNFSNLSGVGPCLAYSYLFVHNFTEDIGRSVTTRLRCAEFRVCIRNNARFLLQKVECCLRLFSYTYFLSL